MLGRVLLKTVLKTFAVETAQVKARTWPRLSYMCRVHSEVEEVDLDVLNSGTAFSPELRYRVANVAHLRQARPDSGRGF